MLQEQEGFIAGFGRRGGGRHRQLERGGQGGRTGRIGSGGGLGSRRCRYESFTFGASVSFSQNCDDEDEIGRNHQMEELLVIDWGERASFIRGV